jgi:hypothetical protein
MVSDRTDWKMGKSALKTAKFSPYLVWYGIRLALHAANADPVFAGHGINIIASNHLFKSKNQKLWLRS